MPSILIKTADELARQRHAGELLASVFTMLDAFIKPLLSTSFTPARPVKGSTTSRMC
jgi:methionine aminopeptidase